MDVDLAHAQDERQEQSVEPVRRPYLDVRRMEAMGTIKRRKGKGLTPQQAENLRVYIRGLGLTLAQLNQRTGLDPSTFSRFLSRDTHGSVDMVDALSADAGVDLWEVIKMKAADSKHLAE